MNILIIIYFDSPCFFFLLLNLFLEIYKGYGSLQRKKYIFINYISNYYNSKYNLL